MNQLKRCAFLSMENLEEFECYDRLLFEPLRKLGWKAEEISWRNKNIRWSQFDAVIVRSPWDYQDDPEAFLAVLDDINQSSAHLENSAELMKWNIDKRYLRDLQQKGVEIVPTLWKDRYEFQNLSTFFDKLENSAIIIKPVISAGAEDTFLINREDKVSYQPKLEKAFQNRAFMVQPFMKNITAEGEFSVFYFGNTYSHTILKTPKPDDFRVQEEHGGRLQKVEPEQPLLETTVNLLDEMETLPLYTRADFVRTEENTFALMELELIEPSLYFNMDPESPERFAQVFDRRMKNHVMI